MVSSLLPNRKPCVVVASMGRSGSTIAYAAIIKQAQTIWRRRSSYFAPTLSTQPFKLGDVYKTHDYPDAMLETQMPIKALFVFGSTLDSAMSVYSAVERYGENWVNKHFENLKSSGTVDDLFDRDVLRFVDQIKAWSTFDGIPTLCVRYDALWRHTDRISEFTNYKFSLPEFKGRSKPSITEELMVKARVLYDPLDEVVMALPEIFVSGSHMAPKVAGL